MAKKKNINDLLKDYEDLLGEDIGEIEAAKVDVDVSVDPDLAKL